MTAVAYPSSLPAPTRLDLHPAERRALSTLADGPEQVRARSRDWRAMLPVEWVYTRAQLATFDAWGASDLAQWTRWFAVTLPGRGGFATRHCRFVARPRWDYIARGQNEGVWRVSGTLEVRGRGVAPTVTDADAGVRLRLLFSGNYADSSSYAATPELLGNYGLSSNRFLVSGSNHTDGSRAKYTGTQLARATSDAWTVNCDVNWTSIANTTNNAVWQWHYADATATPRNVYLNFYSNAGVLRVSGGVASMETSISGGVSHAVSVHYDGAGGWTMSVDGAQVATFTGTDPGTSAVLTSGDFTVGTTYNPDGAYNNYTVDNVVLSMP